MHQLLVTASEELRARLRPLSRKQLLETCAAFRIHADDDSLQAMTRLALRELAQRILHLDDQLASVIRRLRRVTAASPAASPGTPMTVGDHMNPRAALRARRRALLRRDLLVAVRREQRRQQAPSQSKPDRPTGTSGER